MPFAERRLSRRFAVFGFHFAFSAFSMRRFFCVQSARGASSAEAAQASVAAAAERKDRYRGEQADMER